MLAAAAAALPDFVGSLPTILTLVAVPRCPPCTCSPTLNCHIPELICPEPVVASSGYIHLLVGFVGFISGCVTVWYFLPYIPATLLRRRPIRGETVSTIALRKKQLDSA